MAVPSFYPVFIKITLGKLEPEAWSDQLKLKINSGSTKIKVWSSDKKGAGNLVLDQNTTEAIFATPTALNPPKELWVEGIAASGSMRDVQLALVFEKEGSTFSDRINITVIDVDINEPDGSLDWGRNPSDSWETTPFYHFDFQGVRSTEPGSYALTINGSINLSPSSFTYRWTLPTSCGTLDDYTIASPIHTPPTTIGEGTLRLKAEFGGEPTGIMEERRVKIYLDHLERDHTNFGEGGFCKDMGSGPWKVTAFNVDPPQEMGNWNCHGSAKHHYDGSGAGGSGDVAFAGTWNKVNVGGTHILDYPFSAAVLRALGNMNRGDIVSFYSDSGGLQHTHTSMGMVTCYGANNEPAARAEPNDETWKWAISKSVDYANGANTYWGPISGVWFTEAGGAHIVIRQKPNP